MTAAFRLSPAAPATAIATGAPSPASPQFAGRAQSGAALYSPSKTGVLPDAVRSAADAVSDRVYKAPGELPRLRPVALNP